MGFPIWLSTHVSNIIRYSNPDYLTPFQNPTIITNLLNRASFDNMVSHAWRPRHIRHCIAKTGLCHQMWLISTLTVRHRVINTKCKEFLKLRSSENEKFCGILLDKALHARTETSGILTFARTSFCCGGKSWLEIAIITTSSRSPQHDQLPSSYYIDGFTMSIWKLPGVMSSSK